MTEVCGSKEDNLLVIKLDDFSTLGFSLTLVHKLDQPRCENPLSVYIVDEDVLVRLHVSVSK